MSVSFADDSLAEVSLKPFYWWKDFNFDFARGSPIHHIRGESLAYKKADPHEVGHIRIAESISESTSFCIRFEHIQRYPQFEIRYHSNSRILESKPSGLLDEASIKTIKNSEALYSWNLDKTYIIFLYVLCKH